MFKKGILLFALIGFAISCKTDKSSYLISGNLEDVKDSTKVFLNIIEDRKLKTIDTSLVINNSFEFTGSNDKKEVHFITVEGLRSSSALVLENADIAITLHKDSLHTSKISGTKENELLQSYTKDIGETRKKVQSLQRAYQIARQNQDTSTLKTFKPKYDSIMKAASDFDVKFIEDNANSLMAVFVLERVLNNKTIEAKKAKELFDKITADLQESRSGLSVAETLKKELATAIGSIAPSFSAPDPEGKMIALNDIKGKVTIIDFWAAWCGPCRRENPNVVKVYEKYHDKGLEIIGVSLDGSSRQQDPKAAWLKAIEDDGLTWYQVSNLKYFGGEVAKLYNITSIPATFILNNEGEIVAKNLRGQALEDKIAELLN